ncbi:hypothetical protein AciM339_0232 [Aciduliprofundum sp. MAR08-339]|uniref:hypothetical protein n=1 Tax=Aciduliprofundum sp. (strain MAR08-339) TaxID=673860 RepID=UPI0002A48BF6|nr:hypothetical protein AciM339_0200 [Aciduliprofundum sp. MAR08-339]AGB04129.1 hypothetical protein AciM339_0232 [Aciduliprofundum sp. MAR08-339]
MKILLFWNGKVSVASYKLKVEDIVNIAYDTKTRVKFLQYGTLRELGKRFIWLEADGDIEAFIRAMKDKMYEVYTEW